MYDESPPKLVPSTVTAPPAAGSVEGRVATTCVPTQSMTPPPPPPLRTNRTRRVPHPVLIGHAASLTPCLRPALRPALRRAHGRAVGRSKCTAALPSRGRGGGTHPRSTLDISARKPASAAARQVVLASRSAPSLRDPTRREGLQRIIGECLRRVVGEVDRP